MLLKTKKLDNDLNKQTNKKKTRTTYWLFGFLFSLQTRHYFYRLVTSHGLEQSLAFVSRKPKNNSLA